MEPAGAQNQQQATLAILAGGEGLRMGTPKANLTIGGQPILEYLLHELAWPGKTMLVTAPGREHPPGWQAFSIEVTDPVAGGGPLRGLLTALENLATPEMLVLTVDMPLIRRSHGEPLLQELRSDPAMLGVMWRHGSIEADPTRPLKRTLRTAPEDGQIEPFPLAIRAAARQIIAKRLAEGRKSIHGLLEEGGFIAPLAPNEWDERIWTNLNTPADFSAFRG